jgi:hypothetical protein
MPTPWVGSSAQSAVDMPDLVEKPPPEVAPSTKTAFSGPALRCFAPAIGTKPYPRSFKCPACGPKYDPQRDPVGWIDDYSLDMQAQDVN